MSKDIVACTLLIPNTDMPEMIEDRTPVRLPTRIPSSDRADGETGRAGRVPVRLPIRVEADSFHSRSAGDTLRTVIVDGSGGPERRPVRTDALPIQSALDTAAAIEDPDLRYVALSTVHDDLQTFISENPGHPSTGYLMERYFHMRSELPAEVLEGEPSSLDNFEMTRLTRPDGSELIIQETAEGRRRIDVEPGTVEIFE